MSFSKRLINSIHRASTFQSVENSFWQNFRLSLRKWNVLRNLGGGESWEFLEKVAVRYANPDPISDQKMLFSHQFSDLGYLPFTWEIPAGGRIYHKSSRSLGNNLENESPTWSTNIVKSGQEWTALEKKALKKLWEPNFFTLWLSPWIEAWS